MSFATALPSPPCLVLPPFSARGKLRSLRFMNEAPSDEELMLAYGRGQVAAFEQLYARHRGPLFRFLLRGCSDRGLAEEFFQDVWSRIIATRERYRPEAAFRTWLLQIAHNRLVDHYRKQRPQASEEERERVFDGLSDDDGQPERTLSAFEERRRLQLALEELPPDQRHALLLRLEQEMPLEEIGRITGVGRETVKSRLRYALDKVRARLQS